MSCCCLTLNLVFCAAACSCKFLNDNAALSVHHCSFKPPKTMLRFWTRPPFRRHSTHFYFEQQGPLHLISISHCNAQPFTKCLSCRGRPALWAEVFQEEESVKWPEDQNVYDFSCIFHSGPGGLLYTGYLFAAHDPVVKMSHVPNPVVFSIAKKKSQVVVLLYDKTWHVGGSHILGHSLAIFGETETGSTSIDVRRSPDKKIMHFQWDSLKLTKRRCLSTSDNWQRSWAQEPRAGGSWSTAGANWSE